jgi:hypothetical protein
MKPKFLSSLEEKYVFKISQYFWHIFVGLATLGIIVGIGYLIWGIVPSSHTKVEKKEYPQVVQVTIDELKGEKQNAQVAPVIQTPTSTPKQTVESAEGLEGFNQALNELKLLIPPEKYSWSSSGHWYFPNGEYIYQYYKNTQFANNYRRWQIDQEGIENQLNQQFTALSAITYIDKTQLLNAYNSFLKNFTIEKRISILRDLFSLKKENLLSTINTIKTIENVSKTLGYDKYYSFVNFINYNRKDGLDFLEYTNSILGKFDYSVRNGILATLMINYYNYFNNQLWEQKEATDLFLNFLPQIAKEEQVNMLGKYYRLIANKNSERKIAIRNIESDYQAALSQAEYEYQASVIKKGELRLKGVYGIGAGIVLIAFIGLLLVLLSIQRYLKSINDKMVVS